MALALPLIVWTVLFMADMGRLVLAQAALTDASYSAARNAAAAGGTNNVIRDGGITQIMAEAMSSKPGLTPDASRFTVDVESGSVCTQQDPYVTIVVTYQQELLSPGLGSALGLLMDGASGETVPVVAKVVVLCDVAG